MTIQRHFKLALTAGHTIPLVINANQYDSGEQWLFTLYNDGVRYTPSSGAIVGIKADRLGIINTGTVDANGRVVINETRQMTAAVGKNIFELLIDDQTHGTANFMVLVEPRPGDNADLSESDYSLFEEAIQGTSQAAIKAGVQEWMDENLTDPTDPIVDASLSLSGAAADAKKTGDELSALKSAIDAKSGLSMDVKSALMALARAVAFKGDDPEGIEVIDALEDALYPPVNLTRISAVYSGGVVSDKASLNSLKSDLTVTAYYDDGTSETVSDSAYTLSGTIAVGEQTITVSYGGKTTTFTVTVEHNPYLYVMPSEFVSTGANRFETNVSLSAGDVVTFLIDFTATTINTSTTQHPVDYVFGNKVSGESTYFALQTIKTSGSNYLWGCGIGYNSGKNLITEGNRNRLACVLTVGSDGSTHSASANLKDVTAGTAVKTFTNSYANNGAIVAPYFIGKEVNASIDDGFIGTVHDFRIYDGEMGSADITDYLTNGAS